MATNYIFVPGKIMWAKGLAEIDEKYKTYNATLEVFEDTKDKVIAAGCGAKFKPVEDRFGFKIKKSSTRTETDKITKVKSVVDTSPPRVFLTDPNGVDIELDPKTVGNGSEVTCKLEIYDTTLGGKGTRLLAVRVDNLIEFIPNDVNAEDLPF